MKKSFYLLFILLFLSCKNEEVVAYYPDGSKKTIIYTDPKNSTRTIQKVFYETGELKAIAHNINGVVVDTVYYFYKNKRVKEKGLFKNNLNNGWWFYFNENGNLISKKEYVLLDNVSHLNQVINFDRKMDTIFGSSYYFKLHIQDTLNLGKNIGKIKYHPNISNEERFFQILIDNQISDNLIVKDTFKQEKNITRFGIFAHKEGLKKIRGTILETTLILKKGDKEDNSSLTIGRYKRYFEKDVFIKHKDQ
jgi:antitoxin component YwqK of YwqJK toxin-antitoxin module